MTYIACRYHPYSYISQHRYISRYSPSSHGPPLSCYLAILIPSASLQLLAIATISALLSTNTFSSGG